MREQQHLPCIMHTLQYSSPIENQQRSKILCVACCIKSLLLWKPPPLPRDAYGDAASTTSISLWLDIEFQILTSTYTQSVHQLCICQQPFPDENYAATLADIISLARRLY